MENFVGSSGFGRNFSQELENYEDSRNCVEQEETSTLISYESRSHLSPNKGDNNIRGSKRRTIFNGDPGFVPPYEFWESFLEESQATESRPREWTNEKHSLYLKSMEASFVNQLYKSLDLFGSSLKNCQSKPKSYKHKLKSTAAGSGQYKVFQDGRWSKIDVMNDEPRVNNAEDSGGRPVNPWIRHYRYADRQAASNSSVSHIKASSPTTVNQFPACHFQIRHQDSIGSNTEVMGQNFNDEDLEEEKSGRIHDTKRTKTSRDSISSNDQVVPSGIHRVVYAAEDHISSKD